MYLIDENASLSESIRQQLLLAKTADIAVGQLFLTEFGTFIDELKRLSRVRLLLANNSDRSDPYRLLESAILGDSVRGMLDAEKFVERRQLNERSHRLEEWLRRMLGHMHQTNANERAVRALLAMLDSGTLEVKAALRERMPGDLLFTERQDGSNCALYGPGSLFAPQIHGDMPIWMRLDNSKEFGLRFNRWWHEALSFRTQCTERLNHSWVTETTTPYLLYLSVLYRLIADRLVEEDDTDQIHWPDDMPPLMDFQMVAVRQALTMLNQYRGVFIADVVGLGKTYIGTALLKHLAQRGLRATIFCPPSLVPMWQEMNSVYGLAAEVMSTGRLAQFGSKELERAEFQTADRQVVLIDESHRFRNRDSASYRTLIEYTQTRQCILLTATPYSLSSDDIYSQIRLFADDDVDLGLNPPRLSDYFREVRGGNASLVDVLRPLLIRRTRKHIMKHYSGATIEVKSPDGAVVRRALVFPKREKPVVERYDVEGVYGADGLYDYIIAKLGVPEGRTGDFADNPDFENVTPLSYARYGLFHYVRPAFRETAPYRDLKQSGKAVRGFIRILLFKRLESSVHAFRRTVDMLLRVHDNFLKALLHEYVPAGDAGQRLLYEQTWISEDELANALDGADTKYVSDAFDIEALRRDIENDSEIFAELKLLLQEITPDKDGKLAHLRAMLTTGLSDRKVLVFTQYEATAEYLYENLSDLPHIAFLSGRHRSAQNSFMEAIARFAPRANPRFARADAVPINILIATDVLSEGLNLQDCSTVVNYDLHYNPVRLIQRVGRVDRVGSDAESIYLHNFLPERNVEKVLHLEEILTRRIEEIHSFVGEDNAILHPDEQLNDQDMYAAYTSAPDDESETEAAIDFTEIEERIRQMQRDDPDLFQKVRDLPEGVRTGRAVTNPNQRGTFVYFASEDGFDLPSLLDQHGKVRPATLDDIIAALECSPAEPSLPLPDRYNRIVSQSLLEFETLAAQRQTTRKSGPRLSAGQQFALRHLLVSIKAEANEDRHAFLLRLEKAIRSPLPDAAIRELNRLRRMALPTSMLISRLEMLYRDLDLGRFIRRDDEVFHPNNVRIVCSEALI